MTRPTSAGLVIDVPNGDRLILRHLVLDLNGTLADRGRLIAGVAERVGQLRALLELHLMTADTFGSAREASGALGVEPTWVSAGIEKARLVDALGADAVVAIGNGVNDIAMLQRARLGIAVLGPEGAATKALIAAEIVCRSILEALDLLLEPRALAATLRR